MTILLLLLTSFCQAGFWTQTGKELASPVTTDAKYYLLGGSLLTAFLTIDSVEDGLGHDVQDETVEDKPLGSMSHVGNLAGQMLPNAIYIVSMYGLYYFTDDEGPKSKSIHMLKSTIYTGLTTSILKAAIREPRPEATNTHRDSFPSGHTASAFAFASVVGTEHEWYWGVAAYSLAGFVAWSRINDNAHRLHDVVGGAVVGLSYGLSLHYLYKDERSEIAKVYVAPLLDGVLVGYKTSF